MRHNHIRFIAAFAAIALLALGAAGTASAKKKLKLKPDSVLSIHIKDGEVGTNDLAGAAVTATQLAAQSVSTSALEDDAVIGAKVQDDSLTGADVKETSLKYGCGGNVAGIPVQQIAGSGFCAFAILGVNKTWEGASALCRQKLPAAGLPSSDELYLAITGADAQNPLRDVAAAFTEDLLGGTNPVAVLTFSNGGFTSSTFGNFSLNLSQHVCTFNPSDRNG